MEPDRVLIMGSRGSRFSQLQYIFRENSAYEVVAFTATQIPNIDDRTYPPELAGKLYPDGIPIYPEDQLETLIESERIGAGDICLQRYPTHVRHACCLQGNCCWSGLSIDGIGFDLTRVHKAGGFGLCSAHGKRQESNQPKVASILRDLGHKLAVVRHPMPYGDLAAQAVQRFSSYEDLNRYDASIEEREEYEPAPGPGLGCVRGRGL